MQKKKSLGELSSVVTFLVVLNSEATFLDFGSQFSLKKNYAYPKYYHSFTLAPFCNFHIYWRKKKSLKLIQKGMHMFHGSLKKVKFLRNEQGFQLWWPRRIFGLGWRGIQSLTSIGNSIRGIIISGNLFW